jgi:hypothetical protein
VKSELGFQAAHREDIEQADTYVLWEESEAYRPNFASENEALSSESARFWNENLKLQELSLVRPGTTQEPQRSFLPLFSPGAVGEIRFAVLYGEDCFGGAHGSLSRNHNGPGDSIWKTVHHGHKN